MRARNIKPSFFTDEDLVECSFEARLLFIGLWCMADRMGRLEDRPKKIKMEVFPADSIDCGSLLEELERYGKIKRYRADDKALIWIPGFASHQSPHPNEKPSAFPAHPEDENQGPLPPKVKSTSNQGGNDFQPRKEVGQPKDESTQADIMNPDSLNPDSREEVNPKAVCAAPHTEEPQAEPGGDLFMPISDGKPCRIKSGQIDVWQENFRFVDVRGQLVNLIAWFEDDGEKGGKAKRWRKGQWFSATAGWLGKKSQAALLEAQARDPTFDPNDPDGSKAAEERKRRTRAMIHGLAAEKAVSE